MGTSKGDPRGDPSVYGYPQQRGGSGLHGPLGALLLGLQQRRDRSSFVEEREQFITQGADRFQSIGTPEAIQMSELFRSAPKATWQTIQSLGGMGKFEDGLRERAQQQREAEHQQRRQQARREFQKLPAALQTPANLNKFLIEKGFSGEESAAAGEQIQGLQEERRIMKDVDGRQRYVDTGDLVFDIPLMEDLPEPKVPVSKQFTSERELRMEYTKQAQPFINRRRSIGQIIEQGELARNETNPIAQRAVIFAMFKLWDEGSTVHTTEQEQIEKARSPLNLKAAWWQLWGGEILTDTQIDQLQRTAQVSMISDARIQKDLEAQFQGIADEYGLSRTAAVPDFIGDEWRNIKLKATDALVEDYGQRLGTKDSQTILDAMEKDGVVFD